MLARQRMPLLVILPEAADSDVVATDLESFGIDRCEVFPLAAEEGVPEAIRDQDFARRLQILKRLRNSNAPGALSVVTATITSVMQPTPSPSALEGATRTVATGKTIDIEDLLDWLVKSGYHPSTAVELPGEFSQRGGILDIFAPDRNQPMRIEFFGDEVDSIRTFDLGSQRSVETLPSVEFAALLARDYRDGMILDYLPPDAGILIVEPKRCEKVAEAFLERMSGVQKYQPWDNVFAAARKRALAFGFQLAEVGSDNLLPLRSVSVDSFTGELDEVRKRVDQTAGQDQVLLLADTAADAQRMSELMQTTEVAKRGQLEIIVGSLSGGFRLLEPPVLLLTGAELFHRSTVRRVKPRAQGKAIDSFLQLEPGDLVVHLAHGIGLYRGMELIDRNGVKTEHLTIEFDGGTKIYVPATKIGLVQKYVGGTKSRPRLAKIGGQAWA